DLSSVPALSPSPDFLPPECSDPAVPILSISAAAHSVGNKVEITTNPSVIVPFKPEMKDDAAGTELKLGDPKPVQQIHDIVSEEQLDVSLLERPTTVQITETGAVVTTSNASLNKKLVETNALVKLERPNTKQEANFLHTLKIEDSQQLQVKEKIAVPQSISVEEFHSSKQQSDVSYVDVFIALIKQLTAVYTTSLTY
ncbi:hypothetical protein LOAG_15370, partial [Loa loa]